MSQFRLHIDIPLGTDEEEAARLASFIAQAIYDDKEIHRELAIRDL